MGHSALQLASSKPGLFAGLDGNWKTFLALLPNKTKQMLGSEGIMFVSGSGTWTCKTYPK